MIFLAVLKTAEFHADFESVEKLLKNAPKKVIRKTSLTNLSKSEKSAYFRHVFANNFFVVHFSNLFQRIRNQRDTHIEFLAKKFLFALFSTFL